MVTSLRSLTMVMHGCYLSVLFLVLAVNHLGPERWWGSGLNMYVPQWVWGLPAIALVPLTLVAVPRKAYLPIGALFIVAVPLMDLRWTTRNEVAGVPIRVMTFNIQLWAQPDIPSIAAEIAAARPDILCLQDAHGAIHQLGSVLDHWNVVENGEYVIASRFPIESYSIEDLSYGGHSHTYLRAAVDINSTPVTVATTHFLTSRNALSAFASMNRWSDGVKLIRADLDNRLTQAQRLTDGLQGTTGPLIVTGDFNAPGMSLVFRTLAGIGLQNAFADGGRGYGYTFGHTSKFRHSFVRIDHILINERFRAVRVTTGSARASDHRPVIADLRLMAAEVKHGRAPRGLHPGSRE